jgi:hypothetical protein
LRLNQGTQEIREQRALHSFPFGYAKRSISRLLRDTHVVDENVEMVKISAYSRRRNLLASLSNQIELNRSRFDLLV